MVLRKFTRGDLSLNPTGCIRFVSRSRELCFSSPTEIITATTFPEVVPCLERVAAGVARGCYAAGFITYEAASAFDPAMKTQDPGALPLLWFGLYATVASLSFDEKKTGGVFEIGSWIPRVSPEEYTINIQRIQDWIAAGDTYQVNYTFPLQSTFHGDTLSWFYQLCAAQQADYCALVDLGRFRLLSASPELFFKLTGNVLETRPMKGTRPRGRWADEDQQKAQALAASGKDRAENVMIVDLLRNDMTRVSEPGSVRVHSLYDVESYPTVWQMTSTIRSHTSAMVHEIIQALFPSGSVTGAPKIRTMEIIRELESYPRGIYCGTIGWWAPDGQAEFNVAIRTVVVDSQTNQAMYHVGSGITQGSSAADEYDECLIKASLLTRRDPEFELIESLRFDGAYFLLAEHMERLAASARYFGFHFNRESVKRGLTAAVIPNSPDTGAAGSVPLKIRLLLRKDGTFHIQKEPLTPVPGMRVGFAGEPVDVNDVFLFHKTTCRSMYQRAMASRPDCEDVLLWNTRGEITESTIANVVLDIDGKRWTPPVSSGLLEGTYRQYLLAREMISERILTRQDILQARAVFLISSVRQWIKVQWINR